jgi:hypothetical protein
MSDLVQSTTEVLDERGDHPVAEEAAGTFTCKQVALSDGRWVQLGRIDHDSTYVGFMNREGIKTEFRLSNDAVGALASLLIDYVAP